MLTALLFLLILSVLVLIHELGHFLVAKKLGIKVEEFGFGFPPKAFSIKKGETEYSINWLPIGGFVKLYGEDEAGAGRLRLPVSSSKYKVSGKKKKILNTQYSIPNTDVRRAFYARSAPQKLAVVVAGVIMNAVLAAVIFYVFLFISNFKTEIPLLGDYTFLGVIQTNKTELVVSSVSKNSPAQKAGLAPLSKIKKINEIQVTDLKQFVAIVNKNKGKEITIVFEDIKTQKETREALVPRVNPPKGEGAMGIGFFGAITAVLDYKTPGQKLLSGIVHPINLMGYNFQILKRLIAVSLQRKTVAPVSEGVAGPVGIYSLVGTIVQIPDVKERILGVLNLAGVLSMSLAVFNILPIPALDGGRLFFIAIEGITGKKVNQRIEGFIHQIGMIVLLTLILLITFKDVSKLFRP
ncbi:MAG: hypothetical protein A3F31_03400 [Candidatus Levybacteria bacterium RIFCSPHIGHO2_12_FULL_38_12]|nr:MAG: hypothetical protein A2770_03825 [Candidatus Levybacteria bacterium RIFCSPHIGHO2_01_FULL_38_12]OGH22144.1 MAG: hypothetical protein A3D75_02770 [Candidatus Levybacteria bacterium RIFCSPHIGHO2_02_FULL_37_18]OGH22991.1 MAG: hypothetical protein A3F31_03400 [Candidatus Levybacteria bacterium RIFCSPHIGHO2_12_FULL_38_12]OGH44955.1 MAG: hypothetical protein A3J14_01195 [Candidatus Levybacteria bacterium RIFCSPLOWO2_02_FULL_37_18]